MSRPCSRLPDGRRRHVVGVGVPQRVEEGGLERAGAVRSGGRAFAGALEQQRGGERGHKRVGHTQVRGHHAAQGAAITIPMTAAALREKLPHAEGAMRVL